MRVEILDKYLEKEYEEYILRSERALLYASNKYRAFLKDILGSEDCYFVAINRDNQIVGALPTFLMRNPTYGNVLNSLPFFGSNGSIIEHEGNEDVRKKLLEEFNQFSLRNNCVSSTIITSPFESNSHVYEEYKSFNYRDARIGQISKLPEGAKVIEEKLIKQFDEAGRRNIKKAKKMGVVVRQDELDKSMCFLMNTHFENMEKIGGIAKPKSFFEKVSNHFQYGIDFKIYTAYFEGKAIAALMLFYYNNTVEYYVPVVVQDYRTYQGLSLIIFEAMKEAAKMGYRWWNWGGTWEGQHNLYRFKSKWGAEDMRYCYYTNVYDKNLIKQTKETLLAEYPYFYTVPFKQANLV